MNLFLTNEQQMTRDSVATLFAAESTARRVRDAEAVGFDSALWSQLVRTGVPSMRIPEDRGGGGSTLLDAILVAEQGGKYLVAVPLAESIAAGRLLALLGPGASSAFLDRALRGEIATLIPRAASPENKPQLIPAGAIAQIVVALNGESVVAYSPGTYSTPKNLGGSALSFEALGANEHLGEATVLAQGSVARDAYLTAVEEWKLLTAAMLEGLARQALDMAAAYSRHRHAFGRPIGSYQGIAHPLADSVTETDGAQLLVWRAAWACARVRGEAGGFISMAYWWATQAAARAVARALHTFGGYGVSLEYDIQLYYRRGKAWGLAAGDPQQELQELANRLWGSGGELVAPDSGEMTLEFGYGAEADAFAAEVRQFFSAHLTPELKAHAHHSVAGFHPQFNRQLAEAGLLFPHWPKQYGGRDVSVYHVAAATEVIESFGWEHVTAPITNQVAQVLMQFGDDDTKREVLGRFTSGEALACMGFTEPSCGSDVFAITTRAQRKNDLWIIDGQKIFTTSGNLASYCMLLTRTDPALPKHAGLTLFLVPMNLPGIEIQPLQTLQDERTNIVFFNAVTLPDRYRLGEVNGGIDVMAATLELEHGSADHYRQAHMTMLRAATDWARSATRDGRPLLEDRDAAARLARSAVHGAISTVLSRRAIWALAEKIHSRYWGPMAKLFATEYYLKDAMDLMDLTAPESLLPGGKGLGHIELGYRQSIGTTIYGGTSEVQRSLIAEQALGMPKSRS